MKKTVEIIGRMAPGNKNLVFECSKNFDYSIEGLDTKLVDSKNNLYEIQGLESDRDYSLDIVTDKGLKCQRLFRCGEFPGTVINYIHPQDKMFYPSGMCPASPSILMLESGRILVSHDIFYRDMAENVSMIFYSDDTGETWHLLSLVEGCFWGKLFIYEKKLYLLANMHEYGDLVLYETSDEGKSWNKACIVIDGGNKYTGGPHKSAMPIIEYEGRIWMAVEFGSWSLGGHDCGYVTATGDITKRENWTISGFLEYDPNWEGTPKGHSSGCIEGNILMKPDGTMIDFLRYGIDACEPNYGKALYLNIDKSNPGETPKFGKVIDFHGNHSKFSIKYDKKTCRYWTIVNRADKDKPRRRNELILMSSIDIDNWKVEKVLIDYEHNGWPEDHNQVGFQYVDFIFHGDEILYVSRTALNGALNYHDSNCITFHRTRYI